MRPAVAVALTTLAACGTLPAPEQAEGSGEIAPHATIPPAAGAPAGEPWQAALAPKVVLKDGQFRRDDGTVQPIHGLSWFGFNTGGAVDGLWVNDPLADFQRAIYRQKLLGFNAVRLPFSFATLDKEPRNFEANCPDIDSTEVVKKTLAPDVKGVDLSQAPKPSFELPRTPGKCNSLATGTTRERFLETVKTYLRNGFYVLLDNHYREDKTAEANEHDWLDQWDALAKSVYAMPEAQGRVFLDLLNEPGQYDQRWEKTADKAGIEHLYLEAMDRIYGNSPQAIFFIEGTGQTPLGANWGDGFCTDAEKISQLGLSDPRPFFNALAQKPYHDRVVLSPHCYGPAVTFASAMFSGPSLYARLSDSFGFFNTSGFTSASGPLKIPVAPGEFGSRFNNNDDKTFMVDFAKYLTAKGEGDDKRHQPIDAWFYWAWNDNSGDTGGIVGPNWTDIEWVKIAYLETLGLTPWYRGKPSPASAPPLASANGTAAPKASSSPTTKAEPPPEHLQSTQTPSSKASGTTTRTPTTPGQKIAQEIPKAEPQPLPTPPPIRTGSAPPHSHPIDRPGTPPATRGPVATPSTPPKDGRIHGRIHIDTGWAGDGGHFFSYQIHLVNAGDKLISPPYDLRIEGPNFTELMQPWNIENAKLEGKAIIGSITATWAKLEPEGKSEVVIGLVAKASDDKSEIHRLTVAGAEVKLEASP